MRTSNAVNCIIDNVWQMEVSHEEIIDLINTYGSGKRWQLTVSLTMLTVIQTTVNSVFIRY